MEIYQWGSSRFSRFSRWSQCPTHSLSVVTTVHTAQLPPSPPPAWRRLRALSGHQSELNRHIYTKQKYGELILSLQTEAAGSWCEGALNPWSPVGQSWMCVLCWPLDLLSRTEHQSGALPLCSRGTHAFSGPGAVWAAAGAGSIRYRHCSRRTQVQSGWETHHQTIINVTQGSKDSDQGVSRMIEFLVAFKKKRMLRTWPVAH